MIPRLHVITDDAVLAQEKFRARAERVLAVSGSIALHLRGPRTPAWRLSELARGLRERAASSEITLLVNDRVDTALTLALAGAHLGTRSLPPVAARRILGSDCVLGASVHSVEEAMEAAAGGVDYLFVGTLFESMSHEGRSAAGVDLLNSVAKYVRLPLIGIGGVTPARVAAVLGAGGYGVAALSGIWEAPSPVDAIRDYLDALESVDAVMPTNDRETYE